LFPEQLQSEMHHLCQFILKNAEIVRTAKFGEKKTFYQSEKSGTK